MLCEGTHTRFFTDFEARFSRISMGHTNAAGWEQPTLDAFWCVLQRYFTPDGRLRVQQVLLVPVQHAQSLLGRLNAGGGSLSRSPSADRRRKGLTGHRKREEDTL